MKKIRRKLALVFVLCATLTAGCTSVVTDSGPIGQSRQWFNPTLPIHLQASLFDQESAFCEQAAYRWQPIPDVAFSPGLVRRVNDIPNVSVDGATLSATLPLSFDGKAEQSYTNIATSFAAIRGPSLKSDREQRDHLQCLKSLGWQGVSRSWDGTPSALNETFEINARVMDLQRQGYSHPFIEADRIVMIDLADSVASESELTLKVASVVLTGNKLVTECDYRVTSSMLSKRVSVSCGDEQPIATAFAKGSPVRTWTQRYFSSF